MKTESHFPILSPGDPGYAQALSRAERVFAGKETGWKLADCDKVPEGYAVKTAKGYLATQGSTMWFQDTPDGWALYSTEEHARATMEENHSAIGTAPHEGGEIETVIR